MNRRDYLRRAGIAGSLAALAGCTSEHLQEAEREPEPLEDVSVVDVDLPVTQRLEIAAAAIERTAGTEIEDVDALGATLREDLEVTSIAETELEGTPVVSLAYAVDEHVERGLMHHLGLVCGGYAALVAAGHESEKLLATVLDGDGLAFGEYEVRRNWATAYDEGDLTAREYADEVSVTVESV